MANAIKPSSPTDKLRMLILESTTQCMTNICRLLHLHYQNIIDTAHSHTQTSHPSNNIPLHIAGVWAEKRYKRMLTDTTRDRVNTMETALQNPHTATVSTPTPTDAGGVPYSPPYVYSPESWIATPTSPNRPLTPYPLYQPPKPRSVGRRRINNTHSPSAPISTGDATGRVRSETGQLNRVKTRMMTRPFEGKAPAQVQSEPSPSPSTSGELSSPDSPWSGGTPPRHTHRRTRPHAHTVGTQHIQTNTSTQTFTSIHTQAIQTDTHRPSMTTRSAQTLAKVKTLGP